LDGLQAVLLAAQDHQLRKHTISSSNYPVSSSCKSCKHSSKRSGKIVAIILVGLCLQAGIDWMPQAHALGQNDAITAALNWLLSHQQADGSYGSFTEPQTAPAAYALWVQMHDSSNVLLSLRWLKNQLQNTTTTWFWGGGGNIAEADVPGEILYSFSQTNNLQLLNQLSQVEGNLSKFQQSNGGFLGYVDTVSGKQVTSSVDTAMALLGLIGANGISNTNKNSATGYLLSLQNPNGSFNLTSTTAANSLYSLGPDPVSITALVLLALQAASFTATNSHVKSALTYLTNAAGSSFNGHVYAASLSLLVFANYGDPTDATTADNYIISQQNADGGFRDVSRSSTISNPLDTGWAALGLQLGGGVCCAVSGGGGSSRSYRV
jgi:prenyltransferase beta subunit